MQYYVLFRICLGKKVPLWLVFCTAGGRYIQSGVCTQDAYTGKHVCGCYSGYQQLYDLCVPIHHSEFLVIFKYIP